MHRPGSKDPNWHEGVLELFSPEVCRVLTMSHKEWVNLEKYIYSHAIASLNIYNQALSHLNKM